MKSLIYNLVAICIAIYVFYEIKTFEQFSAVLSILLAITLIYANSAMNRVRRLEYLIDSKDEKIVELAYNVEEIKNKLSSLDSAFNESTVLAKADSSTNSFVEI